MIGFFKSIIVNKLSLLLLLFLNAFSVDAQNFERISNKEGFNQNTINYIEQDQYGFFWFGTPNGLIKFDGYEFKTINTQSKTNGNISSNYISKLYNDKNGILWIGTNLGVNLYIHSIEKFITLPLPEKFTINKISKDKLGNIWISGENQLFVCKIVNLEKEIYKIYKNLINNNLIDVVISDFSFKDESNLILVTDLGIKQVELKKNKNFKFS